MGERIVGFQFVQGVWVISVGLVFNFVEWEKMAVTSPERERAAII
jgi:hypothetical protein